MEKKQFPTSWDSDLTEPQDVEPEKKGGIHDDHRSRVRRRALREGLRHFEPHEILELLLFYAIPRKDTNPIGHRLLDRYQTLAGVFDADYQDLVKQEGLGETSAMLLKLIPELARMYLLSKEEGLVHFQSVEEIGYYLMHYYIGVLTETPVLLLFNNNRELITEPIELGEGTVNTSAFNIRRIAQLALQHDASAIVLAHNHPDGESKPSKEDIVVTRNLKNSLEMLDIKLLDHIVVGRNGATCILYTVEYEDEYFAVNEDGIKLF